MVHIVQRQLPASWQFESAEQIPPVLQRVYAARGVTTAEQTQLSLQQLLPYHSMKGIAAAVDLLLPVIQQQRRLLIVGDFDVDGATSTALAIRALRMMGASCIDYLVPNRFDFGYGLTPELVEVAVSRRPDLIMTVDNGIAAMAGVRAATQYGIPVLVTDHHLPADQLPNAAAIVNPNQPGCDFPSKAACGCTVVFYLMLALKARLIENGYFASKAMEPPNLVQLIDLVALATVADVVPLDLNNRILVEQGLRRIRAGRTIAGISALLQVAGKNRARVVSADFGFAVGPRLNAAGRLDDMALGIECLLCDEPSLALQMAAQLDELNRDRRQIEAAMTADAERFLAALDMKPVGSARPGHGQTLPAGVCLFHRDWHQGVIGILASRVKEKIHRPVIAFALADTGELKGSARSIAGLHMRDALDLLHKRHPHLMTKFGGHAMAAGLTVVAGGFDAFVQAFAEICQQLLSADDLTERTDVDGQLQPSELTLTLAEQLRWAGPWGQGFPAPVFTGVFHLQQQRLVGEKHLKMLVQPEASDVLLDAICFNVDPKQWPSPVDRVELVYQLDVNEFRGRQSVQLLVSHISTAC
ncbi:MULTISPECIES: single-stranded-DNA-specific exonuclease RecJ [unclassified Oceanobacter]|uniref:single-stranded-DNA-specific exonuclease RecJ n=1 Tax=unclassified Oceanobacter TaxID=2620260 RepID=UPI0027345A8D|nr:MULTISPECIES: single-stranded-DNA-specific exonuclease RecJ [unclassified Oceanobacter]MDP2507275.1 single-stranded-DNA-specific exonuclease RecJ [Oceanobacter sp. 3_MG-2023]MDP2549428.1 single-stranded-DNA-specific exonuclease RecJ [Oceanobacter sp. 4_MG-2023]MDP2608336.1 single-stranded-DNA-specific exonuclease RecJ [Oceanobacter sp. 1_MG-2023]MDP2612221.1 single-stranded-DNA-specific exonuclease RecJ [Oceanobacter sp. 2_MG-2023]